MCNNDRIVRTNKHNIHPVPRTFEIKTIESTKCRLIIDNHGPLKVRAINGVSKYVKESKMQDKS